MLCEQTESRAKRSPKEIDFSEKELDTIVEKLKALDWLIDYDPKGLYTSQQAKDNNMKLNILNILFANYIDALYSYILDVYTNGFFW